MLDLQYLSDELIILKFDKNVGYYVFYKEVFQIVWKIIKNKYIDFDLINLNKIGLIIDIFDY